MWSSCSLIYKVTYTRILWSSLLSLNSSHVSEWWCGKTHQRMTSYWCQSLREVNLKMSYNSRASELKLLLMQPVKLLSRVRLFEIPWTVAYQVPPFMEFSRQKYWSGLPFPPPEDLPDPRIKPVSLKSPSTGRWVLYNQHHLGSPKAPLGQHKFLFRIIPLPNWNGKTFHLRHC